MEKGKTKMMGALLGPSCNQWTPIKNGGQSGAVVTPSHGNVQEVGSNPAVTRNENGH